MEFLIPYIIPIATVLFVYMSSRNTAKKELVDDLEKRTDLLEKQMQECIDARNDLIKRNTQLADENLRLLRQVVGSVVSDKIDKKEDK